MRLKLLKNKSYSIDCDHSEVLLLIAGLRALKSDMWRTTLDDYKRATEHSLNYLQKKLTQIEENGG